MQMHQWCTGAQGWCKFCTTPVQFHRQRRIHKEQQLAIVKPGPTTLAGCWDFSFTKSRLILASTDQPATASMLFNHRCNAATNFLSLTCIHNSIMHRSNSWPVKSGNDRNQTFFSNLQCAGLSSYIDVEDFQGVEHCNYYQGLEYCHCHVLFKGNTFQSDISEQAASNVLLDIWVHTFVQLYMQMHLSFHEQVTEALPSCL